MKPTTNYKTIQFIGLQVLNHYPIRAEMAARVKTIEGTEYFLQDVTLMQVMRSLHVVIGGKTYFQGDDVLLTGEERKSLSNAILEQYKTKNHLFGLRAVYQ